MTQPSANQFLEVIERSGLVDKTRLEREIAELEQQSGDQVRQDTQVLSSHLTRKGLLTGWQSERLLEGRHRGFFIGKYKLLDHLGTGGMSSVYLAEHPVMRRRVALKVLPTNRVEDSSYLRRFHREARAVATLDHRHIVRAFDVDHDGDVHYLVMEYVPGRDLKTLVEQDGPLPPRMAAEYIRQAAEGLAHAHSAGLVHRDMKPANLLVDLRGTVKVLDLGLASIADDIDAALSREFDDKVLGTIDYLAPEQALNSQLADRRADIYGLGGTLYFALTGHPPFPTGSMAQRIMLHQTSEPADIRGERPEVPAALTAICRRMMAKSPERRYQTMEEVSEALLVWLRDSETASQRAAARLPAARAPDEEWKLAPIDELDRPSSRANPPSPTSRPRATQPSKPRRAKPLQKASRQDSLWDDLLSTSAPLADTFRRPALKGGSAKQLSSSLSTKRPARQNRWESPWFVIGIGAALAIVVLLLWWLLWAMAL
ncbi:MAG TPA: serine/threonine-protein kinase [Pirellulales bacterium]|nr:serine/threonine-protein kinase [Pirellulales bacterium]